MLKWKCVYNENIETIQNDSKICFSTHFSWKRFAYIFAFIDTLEEPTINDRNKICIFEDWDALVGTCWKSSEHNGIIKYSFILSSAESVIIAFLTF